MDRCGACRFACPGRRPGRGSRCRAGGRRRRVGTDRSPDDDADLVAGGAGAPWCGFWFSWWERSGDLSPPDTDGGANKKPLRCGTGGAESRTDVSEPSRFALDGGHDCGRQAGEADRDDGRGGGEVHVDVRGEPNGGRALVHPPERVRTDLGGTVPVVRGVAQLFAGAGRLNSLSRASILPVRSADGSAGWRPRWRRVPSGAMMATKGMPWMP